MNDQTPLHPWAVLLPPYILDLLRHQVGEDFTDLFLQFVRGMIDQMLVSRRYDRVVPDAVADWDWPKSIQFRLDKFRDDGNLEWLMDVANFMAIMSAFPYPPRWHSRSAESHESPGHVAAGQTLPISPARSANGGATPYIAERRLTIYITGRFRDRAQYRVYRAYLSAMGHRVTSSWLDEDDALPPESAGDRDLALRDCQEIDESDLVIADITAPLAPDAGAGREWEQGYAWARHRPIWLIGVPKGAFHHLASRQFPTWDAVLIALTPAAESRYVGFASTL